MNRRLRLLFILVATTLSVAAAVLAAGGIYLFGFRHYHVENLALLRRFDVVRGLVFDPKFRRLVQLVEEQRTERERDLFATVWDTNVGVALSKKFFRPVNMFGTVKYAYKPNLQKVAFRAGTGTFQGAFEMEDSPAVRAALPDLNLTHFSTASYDEHGFRRVDADLARDCRGHVLFLGDSFTDGFWVNDNDTFVNRYGWLVRGQSHLNVCPVNAGVNGYGSMEEAHVLEHSFDVAGRPRLVVVMYYANDVEGDVDLLIHGTLPDGERRWEASFSYLRRMAEFSRRQGATLVLVAIPLKEQFADLSTERHYGDVLRLFGQREGVLVIDLLDMMKQYSPDDLYWDWDPHFTPFGHQVVAEILYQQTKELLTRMSAP